MIEDVGVGLIKGIYHLLKWLVIDTITKFICYWIGKIVLLTFTLGHYPKGIKADEDETKIIATGLTLVIIFILAGAILS